jgi:hypothetical protein
MPPQAVALERTSSFAILDGAVSQIPTCIRSLLLTIFFCFCLQRCFAKSVGSNAVLLAFLEQMPDSELEADLKGFVLSFFFFFLS